MSVKGFVRIGNGYNDGEVESIYKDIMEELMHMGVLKIKGINISSVVGYEWEVKDPEEERLKKRVEELEDGNARLYRQITESYDRRSRRLGVE